MSGKERIREVIHEDGVGIEQEQSVIAEGDLLEVVIKEALLEIKLHDYAWELELAPCNDQRVPVHQ